MCTRLTRGEARSCRRRERRRNYMKTIFFVKGEKREEEEQGENRTRDVSNDKGKLSKQKRMRKCVQKKA